MANGLPVITEKMDIIAAPPTSPITPSTLCGSYNNPSDIEAALPLEPSKRKQG